MNKRILALSLVISLLIGLLALSLIPDHSYWFANWTIGVLLGIYPFVFWQIAQTILNNISRYYQQKASSQEPGAKKKFLYYFLLILAIAKFVVIGVVVYNLNSWLPIRQIPLLAGFLTVCPTVLIVFFISYFRNSARQGVSRR